MNISALIMSDEELAGIKYSLLNRKGHFGLVDPPHGRMRHPVTAVRSSLGSGNPWLHGTLTETVRYDPKGREIPGTYYQIDSAGSGHSVSIIAVTLREEDTWTQSRETYIQENLLSLMVPAYRFPLWNETDGRQGVWLWEYPGGGLGNLSSGDGARLELGQETGFYAEHMEEISCDAVARGLSGEIMHSMIAYGIREASATEAAGADDSDVLGEPRWVSQKQIREMISLGIIADTQTKTSELAKLAWLDVPDNRDKLITEKLPT